MPALFYFLGAHTGPCALLPLPHHRPWRVRLTVCPEVETAFKDSWSLPWPQASLFPCPKLLWASLPLALAPGVILLQHT